MDIKGQMSMTRANQGFQSQSISTTLALLKQNSYWQDITATGAQDVTLPDATTLPKGWKVVINAEAGGNLTVKDGGAGATLQIILAGSTLPAYEFTLLDNGTTAGVWFVSSLDNAGVTASTRYVLPHDATTDWGAPSGGYYTIATTEATHGRGVNPMIQFYEDVGAGVLVQTQPDSSTVQTTGNHDFKVPESPDMRYAGKVVFV
jgi:hypothetical protein